MAKGGPTGSKIPKGYKSGAIQSYTPEQMDLFKSLFVHVAPGSQLAKQASGDLSAFAPQEQLAARDFQNYSGQLGSRFSQLAPGAMSAQRGSGFQNAATQGASDFAMQLAGQRQALQRQALGDLMGISHTLLNEQPYQQFLTQKQPKQGFFSKLFGAAAPIAGAAIGGIFGGPGGAAMGGKLGGQFGSGFTGQQGMGSQWQPVDDQYTGQSQRWVI